MNFNILWKLFISSLVKSNININSYSSTFSLANLMNILKNFNDLRHYNDFLNNFLENIRNLDEFLFSSSNSDRDLLYPINDLQNLLNIVHISHNFFQFFSIN